MKRSLLLILILILIPVAIYFVFLQPKVNIDQGDSEVVFIADSTKLNVSVKSKEALVKNYLGDVSDGKTYNVDVYKSKADSLQNVSERILSLGWKLTKDWEHLAPYVYLQSEWEFQGNDITIVMFEDLGSVEITSIEKTYGITGIESQDNMIVIFTQI